MWGDAEELQQEQEAAHLRADTPTSVGKGSGPLRRQRNLTDLAPPTFTGEEKNAGPSRGLWGKGSPRVPGDSRLRCHRFDPAHCMLMSGDSVISGCAAVICCSDQRVRAPPHWLPFIMTASQPHHQTVFYLKDMNLHYKYSGNSQTRGHVTIPTSCFLFVTTQSESGVRSMLKFKSHTQIYGTFYSGFPK